MIAKIVCSVFHILSIYLVLIGTWRLASATLKSPGGDLGRYEKLKSTYNPLKDLIAPKEVLFWMFETTKNFGEPEYFAKAEIFHKRFRWGLFWLMSGILIQFVLSLLS